MVASQSDPHPLNWIDIPASDTPLHPTALADIAHRSLDGMTISGVFSPAEAARAVERLETHRGDMNPAIFGTMLGVSLADLDRLTDDPTDRGPYLDCAEQTNHWLIDAFGFDPFERIAATITPMANSLIVTPPTEHGRPYPPANVRWMEPGGGGLPAHVGNEFELQGSVSSTRLREVSRIRDHYSWFVVLQAPDEGGSLTVFDRVYETPMPTVSEWGGTGRTDTDFDDVPGRKVAAVPGTMVLFGGGWRWHRVDQVHGSHPRITYGGFASPSTDGREFHLWF